MSPLNKWNRSLLSLTVVPDVEFVKLHGRNAAIHNLWMEHYNNYCQRNISIKI